MSARRAALVALVTLAAGGRAQAYVRSTAQMGNAKLYWKESCVPLTVYLNGFDRTTGLRPEHIVKSVAAAAHAWGPDGVTCADGVSHPYLEIVPSVSTATGAAATGYDARNVLVFRTDNWTVGGKPNGKEYDFNALAVTTVFAKGDGHIVDADMEVNGITKAWMNLDPGVSIPGEGHGGTALDFFDLQNTLTHEFGHFIGLAHTCFKFDAANPTLPPSDEMGNTIPDCTDAPGSVSTTVMFDSAMPLETSKRTLSSDDKLAVCEIYAASREHQACSLDQPNVGCAVAAPRGSRAGRAGVVMAAAALLAVVFAARRRARR